MGTKMEAAATILDCDLVKQLLASGTMSYRLELDGAKGLLF